MGRKWLEYSYIQRVGIQKERSVVLLGKGNQMPFRGFSRGQWTVPKHAPITCMHIEPWARTESLNLAVCHACALYEPVRRTNSFLDRGVVIGTFHNPKLGFYDML